MPGIEQGIQNQIIHYLEDQGWYVQRLNSGAARVKGHKIMLAKKGTPDIMAFINTAESKGIKYMTPTRLIFVEVKQPGKKPTVAQTMKMIELESFGARCIVAHSLEGFQKQL